MKKIERRKVSIPSAFEPLFKSTKRKNFVYGGRGSGKSWQVARLLVSKAVSSTCRILCTREYQNSIAESVHKLLSDTIYDLGYEKSFTIQQNKIIGYNGSEFLFYGVRTNPDEIKSMENVSYCWVEEAQRMTQYSLDILIPTIRKAGSQLYFTFNPYKDTDPVYVMSQLEDEDTLSLKVNFSDNPFFPEVLKKEMEWDKAHDYDKYLWVWEGQCRGISKAQIFRGKYEKKEFETPDNVDFYYGIDWGFANDPLAVSRSFVLGNTLYIDYEAYGVGIENDELVDFICTVPGAAYHPLPADNSRPETISHVRSGGLNCYACEKPKGSVEDGITYLRGFDKIVIHPRCKNTFLEFEMYQYKVDRMTNEILPIPVDKYNHIIDSLRYAHFKRMRSINSGSVYSELKAEALVSDTFSLDTVYCGTYCYPGKTLYVYVVENKGRLVIVETESLRGVVDFERMANKATSKVIWFPLLENLALDAYSVNEAEHYKIEIAVNSSLPNENEGTTIVNHLLKRNSLVINKTCYNLLAAMTERAYKGEGWYEGTQEVTEMTRLCILMEYTVWRCKGWVQE